MLNMSHHKPAPSLAHYKAWFYFTASYVDLIAEILEQSFYINNVTCFSQTGRAMTLKTLFRSFMMIPMQVAVTAFISDDIIIDRPTKNLRYCKFLVQPKEQ